VESANGGLTDRASTIGDSRVLISEGSKVKSEKLKVL